MADERLEGRETNWRRVLPWTELFRAFPVALDPKKLLVAAAGVLVMSLGWWLLSAIFHPINESRLTQLKDSAKWFGASPEDRDKRDFAKGTYYEKYLGEQLAKNQALTGKAKDDADTDARERSFRRAKAEYESYLTSWRTLEETAGSGGSLGTLIWYENRGPNPYLVLTPGAAGDPARSQWRPSMQLAVVIEPLYKFLIPITYLLTPGIGYLNGIYFLLCLFWMLAVWAFFGGVLTRMAALQVAGKDRVSLREAIRFVAVRYLSYLKAPLIPLGFVALVTVGVVVVLGFLQLVPILGDIGVNGLLWPIQLAAGLVQTILLIGLIGYPLMFATISAEGSDEFDALSRSYTYVYQSPWNFVWNSLVALTYGGVLVFVVGFMSSMAVYLAKWNVAQTPGTTVFDRSPEYLFVYAPTSFHWRDLLLQGSTAIDPATGSSVVPYPNKDLVEAGLRAPVGIDVPSPSFEQYYKGLSWWNVAGAFLVNIWLSLLFLFVVGFGYSFFWVAATQIYLLMRRKVDETELDEVYIEDDEPDSLVPPTLPGTAGPVSSVTTTSVTMVDPPALRTSPPPPPIPAPVAPPAPPVLTAPPTPVVLAPAPSTTVVTTPEPAVPPINDPPPVVPPTFTPPASVTESTSEKPAEDADRI